MSYNLSPRKGDKTIHSNYNINQLSLNMATFYEPEKNHQAHYIHYLVESIDFDDSYTFGRPFEYEPRVLLKLVFLAYSYGIFSCQKIEPLLEKTLLPCD